MRKYHFVVGVSLAALEEEVDRLVSGEPDLRLIQVLFAAGSGFVGIVERYLPEDGQGKEAGKEPAKQEVRQEARRETRKDSKKEARKEVKSRK